MALSMLQTLHKLFQGVSGGVADQGQLIGQRTPVGGVELREHCTLFGVPQVSLIYGAGHGDRKSWVGGASLG